jgi:prepilin-type N-terminal cleavage/methylation domain-containing protein
MNNTSIKRRGFTLVEMLVVLGIIVIDTIWKRLDDFR